MISRLGCSFFVDIDILATILIPESLIFLLAGVLHVIISGEGRCRIVDGIHIPSAYCVVPKLF
jgi:hypothetical protein